MRNHGGCGFNYKLKKRWNIYRDRIPEINCIQKNAGGGINMPHPLVFWGNQMKTAAKLLQTRQFIQLTRIKSWDNIEKIGKIPTD